MKKPVEASQNRRHPPAFDHYNLREPNSEVKNLKAFGSFSGCYPIFRRTRESLQSHHRHEYQMPTTRIR